MDSANSRVQVFSKEGKFLDKFGTEGSAEGQLNHPWGITMDGKGDVYVADWRNDRIQKFGPDGGFKASFGSSGNEVAQFNRPTDVEVDQDGDIYVVDWLNHRVQIFTPEFRYITTLKGDATMSKWGERAIRANAGHVRMFATVLDMTPMQRFWFPMALAVDAKGNVVVVDSSRFRLQVYIKGEMYLAGYRG